MIPMSSKRWNTSYYSRIGRCVKLLSKLNFLLLSVKFSSHCWSNILNCPHNLIHTNLIFWCFYLFGFWGGSTLRVKTWLKSCHKSLLLPTVSHISKITSLWVTWFRCFQHLFLVFHGFHHLFSCLVWFLFSIIITHHSTKLRMSE